MTFTKNNSNVRRAGRRRKIFPSVTVEQFRRLLKHPLIATEPYRTMVLLAGCTSLRAGELAALRWCDVNVDDDGGGTIYVRTAKVCKTPNVPLSPRLAAVLWRWRSQSRFSRPDDLMFASPFSRGKLPYHPARVHYRLKAAGVDIGFGALGWHTLRVSYATWLRMIGVSITVHVALMRYARAPTTPLDAIPLDGAVLGSSMREANSKLADLVMGITPGTKAHKDKAY
jgi:integrase